MTPRRIIISRTDNIGDVVLTLPIAGILKQELPDSEILFLGNSYTQPVIRKCRHIDHFVNWDNEKNKETPLKDYNADTVIHVFPRRSIALAAWRARISMKIGTSHRAFHWLTCNKLVNLGRKNSKLHECLLNLKLLHPLGVSSEFDLDEIPKFYGFRPPEGKNFNALKEGKFNLIMHMKSKGSAGEWPADKYLEVAGKLGNNYNIILTGTEAEGRAIKEECPEIFELSNITDTAGQYSLDELTDLIQSSDGLLACSTGPLHIAAASGIHTLGLYPLKKPMHAGRWGPVGNKTAALSEKEPTPDRTLNIDPAEVIPIIRQWS